MAKKKEMCSSENHEPGAGIVLMKLEELHSFEGHPFKVERNQELFELRCSIEKEGVLVPLLVRKNPHGDGYEIIAGHRRKEAALWAGLTDVPVIIRELDDDQSVIAMVDSNLQREKILPSEKAFAYKMRLEAMKHQGRAEADTSDPLEPKCKTELVNVSELEAEFQKLGKVKIQKKGGAGGKRSNEQLASVVGESVTQIKRYIRLTHLIPKILDMVDKEILAIRSAVEISFLSEDEQYELHAVMELEQGMQRSTMQDAISAPKVGGIVRLTRFILRGIFLIELLGALAMLPVFCRDYGWRGIWMAVFHSVSAFCNAGFDILGMENNLYPSLTSYAGSPIINITIMLLIVTGGIGFLTWDDICENKLHFRRYRMQSKVILVTTAFLLVLPAIFFFFVDFSSLPIGKRVLASFFQSVTPRTAGFNTVILSDMTGASQAVMIFLMMIGGSPGSTASGMKTTTLAVLVANAAATFRQRESAQFFGRRIECGVVKTAATVVTMYLALFFGGAIFISVYENLPLSSCLYETASAVGTVGLTLGITPQLHIPSQMVLIVLMYLGRVGGLTLIYAALSGKRAGTAKLPLDRITVG